MLGTVRNSEIQSNRDSSQDQRVLGCEITSPEDVQSVEQIGLQGDDYSPQDGDVVLVIPITEAYKLGLVIDDQVPPASDLEEGEKEIYSKDGSIRRATIRLKNNSDIVLNNGTNYAVMFNELKAKVEELENQLKTHVHPESTGGTTAVSAQLQTFPTSIDTARADQVRL